MIDTSQQLRNKAEQVRFNALRSSNIETRDRLTKLYRRLILQADYLEVQERQKGPIDARTA